MICGIELEGNFSSAFFFSCVLLGFHRFEINEKPTTNRHAFKCLRQFSFLYFVFLVWSRVCNYHHSVKCGARWVKFDPNKCCDNHQRGNRQKIHQKLCREDKIANEAYVVHLSNFISLIAITSICGRLCVFVPIVTL